MAENEISGGSLGNVVQAREVHQLTINASAETAIPRYLRYPARWPLASGWDALSSGVHKARPGGDGSRIPPYVPRDMDAALRERIARGGLVLVVGDSTAGKTRAAFEAIRTVFPGHRVLAPPIGSSLRHAPDAVERSGLSSVVWLDNLEKYLVPDGLEPEVLADFTQLRTPVVATMRLKAYETFTDEHDSGTGSQVLRAAEIFDLHRLWSDAELSRAAGCGDSRILDALAHHALFGVAEYLAAGPALLQEWRRARSINGHARGAALVAAAVDLARTGLRAPWPRTLLAELHEHHLAAAGGAVLRPESLDAAFAWASRIRYGVTSLLLPAQDDAGGEGWGPFDYLVDQTDSEIPSQAWEAALVHASDDTDLLAISKNAFDAAPQVAERALRPLAVSGLRTSAFNLGFLLNRQGREAEARQWWTVAADRGLGRAALRLALLAARDGALTESREWCMRAISYGPTHISDKATELLNAL
ncbi:hypothetical protein [Streptomyces murinus]|uniref:Sel1 repeat family protein n=1 Tax=Streptomyces murinus TaxID=33900 RepID=A0A7W3NHX3_STRMR|nr:hypothetical protein [Streptomyces murinus]MBA9050857.1 hypothetical protein [Streptomyces murinus]